MLSPRRSRQATLVRISPSAAAAFRKRSGLWLPPEQPSDDGAEELARGAASVVEGRWHSGVLRRRRQPDESDSAMEPLGERMRLIPVDAARAQLQVGIRVHRLPHAPAVRPKDDVVVHMTGTGLQADVVTGFLDPGTAEAAGQRLPL
jgi:hypothetical protein